MRAFLPWFSQPSTQESGEALKVTTHGTKGLSIFVLSALLWRSPVSVFVPLNSSLGRWWGYWGRTGRRCPSPTLLHPAHTHSIPVPPCTSTQASRMGSNKWLQVHDLPGGKSEPRILPGPAQDSIARVGDSSLSLVTICGRTQEGKSFLLNQLVGDPFCFGVHGNGAPKTKGADVSPILSMQGTAPKVAYVDAEGLGGEDVLKDVLLLTPLLLVSSVFIYNWRGGAAKEGMLKQLGVLADVAHKVLPPASKATEQERRIFGHLHIVLRNRAEVGDAEEVLLDDEKPGTGVSVESVAKRNRVRQVLRESFRSIKISALPTPTDDEEALSTGDITKITRNLTKEFKAALAALKTSLKPHIREGKVDVEGKAFTGTSILHLTKEVAALLNSEQDRIMPESIFAALQRRVFESRVARHISPPSEWLRVTPKTGDEEHIFTIKDDQLVVLPVAVKLNLVTVLALPNSGKSSLLNQLVGKPDCFCPEAERGLARLALVDMPEDGPPMAARLGYVELGSGGSWVEDLVLLFPLLLVSKVVILNWAGPLDKNKMLESLAALVPGNMRAEDEEEVCSLLTDYARRLGMKMDSAEALVLTQVVKRGPIFGHLHIVLHNQPNASAVEGLQDEMRAAFNQSFQSINLWTLPTPGTGAQPTEAGDARATVGVPDGFEQAVGGLKAYLATQLHEPRVFDGSELFYLTIYSFMTSACWRGKDKPDAYKRNLVPLLAFVIKYVQSLEATSPLKAIGAGAVTAGAVAVAGAGAVAVAGVVILPGAFLGAAVFGAYKTAEYAYYYHRGRALKEERKEEERRSAKTKK